MIPQYVDHLFERRVAARTGNTSAHQHICQKFDGIFTLNPVCCFPKYGSPNITILYSTTVSSVLDGVWSDVSVVSQSMYHSWFDTSSKCNGKAIAEIREISDRLMPENTDHAWSLTTEVVKDTSDSYRSVLLYTLDFPRSSSNPDRELSSIIFWPIKGYLITARRVRWISCWRSSLSLSSADSARLPFRKQVVVMLLVSSLSSILFRELAL